MNHELARCVLFTFVSYLSGSILFSYWIPQALYHVDVREYGEDGNPGGFNAITACGFPVGVLCIALDILKGTVPVLAAVHWGELSGWYMVPVVIAPVAGHAWPVQYPGKGGKAISVSFGVMFGLLPQYMIAVIWAILYLILLPVIRDHRILTRVSSLLLLLCIFALYPATYVRALTAGVVGILQIKHHKPNVQTEKNQLQTL